MCSGGVGHADFTPLGGGGRGEVGWGWGGGSGGVSGRISVNVCVSVVLNFKLFQPFELLFHF